MKKINLIILFFAAVLFAQDLFAQPAIDEPDTNGWHIAYGNELTEQQVAQGQVNSQLSLYSDDTEGITAWADFMLRQAVALMVHQNHAGTELADKFTLNEQREAGMFGVAAIKKLLKERKSGYEQFFLSSLVFKAGLIERGGKFIPYFALNMKQQLDDIQPAILSEPIEPVYEALQAAPQQYYEKAMKSAQLAQFPPSAHVWEYLINFGDEPEHYATYSYLLAGRDGSEKYAELVNRIQGSTTEAKKNANSKNFVPEELNIFLIPVSNTDGSAYEPNYDFSKSLLDRFDANSKLNFDDRPGPYIITLYQPISTLQRNNPVVDTLYVDLTNINKGAIAELVRTYKQAVLNDKLNGLDKLSSLRLSILNLAFMTEESIGFAKTASASLQPIFPENR